MPSPPEQATDPDITSDDFKRQNWRLEITLLGHKLRDCARHPQTLRARTRCKTCAPSVLTIRLLEIRLRSTSHAT